MAKLAFDITANDGVSRVLDNIESRYVKLEKVASKAGVMVKGKYEATDVGTPQGGNLSPLLSNIMLNELDKELEARSLHFVRYADDCMIFCKSRKGAERTLNNIVPYIEKKLFLKVNRIKTCVAHISKVKYLGYSFYRYRGKCRFRVHPKSVTKMKNKIRELTDRSNGWGNEYRALKLTQFIRGWVNYFGMADMKRLLQDNDEWLRHRIRAIYSSNTSANSAWDYENISCDLAKPKITVSATKKPGKLYVTWAEVDGASSYVIYRATSKNGTYKKYSTTTKTAYTNTSVTKGKTYYYKVVAVYKGNSAANSAYSNIGYAKVK